MSLGSKLKTLWWYLKNPAYHRSLWQLIKLKLLGSAKEKSANEAMQWCQERALPTSEAIKQITGEAAPADVTSLHSEAFDLADQRANAAPVKMGGPGNIQLLYSLAESIGAKKIIETGVAYGWSSFSLLLSIEKREGHLFSTDMPYAKMGNEDYVGCVVPKELRSFWTLIRKPDIEGLPEAFEKVTSFDLCHYDSDKSYTGRMWAYPRLWDKLKKKGIFISDDIGDNMAFADFCDKINVTPKVVQFENQFVGVLIKP